MISFVGYPQPSWGFAVAVDADNGYRYWYIHLNNDNPGTDDGSGGGIHAYGPDMVTGKSIIKGQLIGYVGDSGNAENTPPHLHFEAYDGNTAKNPYHGLVSNSDHISRPKMNYPKSDDEILPVNPYFEGEMNLAIGGVDNDATDEIVTGSGRGGKLIKTFELDGTPITQFMPNNNSFTGGIDVAVGDVDNDGVNEIVAAAGPGGKYVKIFEADGTFVSRFSPNLEFTGGINVELGDVDNDGVEEIITATESGEGYVKIFEADGTEIASFYPYGEHFKRGVNVAAGDVSGDEAEEIIAGARKGGGPRVSIFTTDGTRLQTYYAYGSSFKGGIRVASSNLDPSTSKDEIFTLPEQDGSARVKVFTSNGSFLSYSSYFAEAWWRGYFDLVATDDSVMAALGVERRASLREVENVLPASK